MAMASISKDVMSYVVRKGVVLSKGVGCGVMSKGAIGRFSNSHN